MKKRCKKPNAKYSHPYMTDDMIDDLLNDNLSLDWRLIRCYTRAKKKSKDVTTVFVCKSATNKLHKFVYNGRPKKGESVLGSTTKKKSKLGPVRLTSILKAYLQEESDPFLRRTNAEMIIESMVERAKRGNVALIREVFNRIDGRVLDGVVSGNPLGNLTDEELAEAMELKESIDES